MAEQWVRLGMALAVIALISAGLYSFGGGRAVAIEPRGADLTFATPLVRQSL